MKCLTYSQLKQMYEDAIWRADMAWKDGVWLEYITMTRIAARIKKAMGVGENRFKQEVAND